MIELTCNTSTQHRCRNLTLQCIGNLESKVFMTSHMTTIPALRDSPILVRRSKRINSIGAVVLLVRLAVIARQICLDLRSYAHTIADFDSLDIFADLDGLADNLMTNTDGQWTFAPAAVDGVNIGSADTAAVDGNVDVAVFEGLELEFLFFEVLPVFLVFNHEARGLLWVRHCE